jgi:hypothetical protein
MRRLFSIDARLVLRLALTSLGLLAASALSGCHCAGSGGITCDPSDCAAGEECDPETNACTPINCIPGITRCSPDAMGGLQRCNSTGDGYIDVGACGPGQSCVSGATGAACDPPACAPGSAMCQADGSVSYCVVGVFENPVACPSGEVCDPSQGSACVPTECGPNTMFCEEGVDVVRACNSLGTGSTVVETCGNGEVCNAGTCFSMCDLAELQRSFVGCVYMALDTNNITYDDALQYDIAVSNPSTSLTANVVIEVRSGAGGTWSPVATSAVAPGTVWVTVVPDRHVEDTAIAPALAYRITSDIPIVSYQFNSDDLNGASSSSGATILFPKSALGDYYVAMGLPTVLPGFGGTGTNNAGVAIVGAFDGTNVTVNVSTNTLAAPGIPAMVAGDQYSTTINEGDVFQIEAANVGDDVTGTYVTSDQPVSVFSYHEGAVTSANAGDDHYEEEMLPLEAWGTTYPVARIWSADETAIWRILAAEDATTITFTYDVGVTGLPNPSGSSIMLDGLEWAEFTVDGPATAGFTVVNGNIGDFEVTSDKPIQISNWSMTETSMLNMVPAEQWLQSYLFLAPPFFEDTLTVFRRDTSTITLDGSVIPSGMFSNIVAPFQAYRQSLTDGSHLISGSAPSELESPPWIHVSGDGGSCGYAYIGGLNVAIINPIE